MKLSMPSGGQYRATVRVHAHRIHLAVPAAVLSTALATLTVAEPVRAESCSVTISGAATPAWRQAASSLRLSGPAGDCASIHLEVVVSGARVTFTTRDGRKAERMLSDPAEFEATIAALRVTDPSTEPAPEPSRRGADSQLPKPAPTPEPSRGGQGMYSLQAGSRGGADNLLSLVVNGSASLVLDRWELGVVAAFDFQYVALGGGPQRAPGSAVAAGVTVGRREHIDNAAVLVGSRLTIAGLNDEREVDSGERGGAEVRTGAYFGLVFPRRASSRFRAELGVELVPHDLGGRPADSSEGPMTPWWAVSLLAGVEFGGS